MPLLALGPHVFEIAPLNYQQLERDTSIKAPAIARFGGRPGRQVTGYGEDPITITGILYPDELGGREELAELRATQRAKRPVSMVGWSEDGTVKGKMLGQVLILSIKTTDSKINWQGQGGKVSYSINLVPVSDAAGLLAGWL
ncbi:phage tail protein [Rhizobium sp. YJ-22]|uniref:phage tail protein n=1 Tax=Rhizobium sp. YJ-22 TaxID=3037556 RepID=UPI0024126810|nr:phage tail protein [Rhizobium sp. YJ-22]MDG3575963.1 phage tail protein [Rhizobium sp. YJ-22]